MFNMLMLMSMIMSILLLMTVIFTTMSKKSFLDREKSSPFECGFDPMSSSRIPFSLHFFLMAVIFLIFDVEIVLILPITIIMKYSILLELFMSSMLFMMILMLGLYHEWIQGMLEWAK
uniref:NADH-ubiquinone oxidoreductase chain 3 n=1 Tax=Aphrophora maritima TaxID=868254 RepID=A0A343X9N2_9HEMI|nr:NADH dehydrogenase subunit 3 [Aphrophora maritima]